MCFPMFPPKKKTNTTHILTWGFMKLGILPWDGCFHDDGLGPWGASNQKGLSLGASAPGAKWKNQQVWEQRLAIFGAYA